MIWLSAGARLDPSQRWIAWLGIGVLVAVFLVMVAVVARPLRSKSEQRAADIRDAENRGRAPFLNLARAIEDEMAGRQDDYARGMRDAANRIWRGGRAAPEEDPVAALVPEDRKWLDEMGWQDQV